MNEAITVQNVSWSHKNGWEMQFSNGNLTTTVVINDICGGDLSDSLRRGEKVARNRFTAMQKFNQGESQ